MAAGASAPAGPRPLDPSPAARELSRRTYEVVAAERHAFAATGAGLAVYDIGRRAEPRLAATVFFPGSGNGIWVSGGVAYLALGPDGLAILDVSEPEAPRFVASLDTDGSVNTVRPVVGSARLVVADGAMGVKTIDLADRAMPRISGGFDDGAYARHLDVSGDLVAVAREEAGIALLRLDAEGGLELLSALALPGSARGVVLSRGRCWVAGGPAGLHAIDATNPERPRLLGTIPSEDSSRGVDVAGSTIAVADGEAGVALFEAVPERAGGPPVRPLARFRTTRAANRVSLSNGMALVAEDSAGIRLLDVSRPDAPIEYP